jgi:hypothetical protein
MRDEPEPRESISQKGLVGLVAIALKNDQPGRL